MKAQTLRSKLAVLALAAALLAACAKAPSRPDHIARGDYESTRRYVTELIGYEMRARDITGLSIALVDDQKIAWAEGFGYADKAAGIAATPDTIYRAGSISKLFTAAAVMQLAEQGRLDPDAPLKTYLPEFSIRSRFAGGVPITPRMLMTHHSGLPDNEMKGMWSEHPGPFTDVVPLIRDEFVAYPPNTIFSYSNLGATLLGDALQKVAGANYAVHLERALLQPLGMTRSSFSTQPPAATKAYRKGSETAEPGLRDVPAGGLNASASDLARFLMMVFADGRSGERQVLKPETLREMLRPQNDAVALDLGFQVGLAWMLSGLGGIDIRDAGPVAHHAGGTFHHRSQLIALPRHKLGVVVLSNSSTSGESVNKIATEALKLALEAKTGTRQPEPPPPAASDAPLSQEVVDAYAGYYATAVGLVRVSPGGTRLRAEAFDRSFDLVARADGTFGVRYRFLGIFSVEVEQLAEYGLARASIGGREILLVQSRGQKLLVGEKIAPVPIPQAWSPRSGEYEVVNAAGDPVQPGKITLRPRDGFLVLDVFLPQPFDRKMTLALAAVSDNEAVILGLGRGMGETVRAVTVAGEEQLLYAGYRVRKKRD